MLRALQALWQIVILGIDVGLVVVEAIIVFTASIFAQTWVAYLLYTNQEGLCCGDIQLIMPLSQ